MSNKTQLQTNNSALDGYIARINAAKEVAASLPEAGGGGSSSIETVNITYSDLPDPGATVYYIDGTMTLQERTIERNAIYAPLKGSILVTSGLGNDFPECTELCGNSMCRAFLVAGSTSNLITFTIDGTTYQAEPGMTWGDWVDSSYNTDGYYTSGLGSSTPVCVDVAAGLGSQTFTVLDSNGFPVTSDIEIVSNGNYTLS